MRIGPQMTGAVQRRHVKKCAPHRYRDLRVPLRLLRHCLSQHLFVCPASSSRRCTCPSHQSTLRNRQINASIFCNSRTTPVVYSAPDVIAPTTEHKKAVLRRPHRRVAVQNLPTNLAAVQLVASSSAHFHSSQLSILKRAPSRFRRKSNTGSRLLSFLAQPRVFSDSSSA